MTILTRGMGAISKHLLKKSKKFPGTGADAQLNKKVKLRVRPKGLPKTIVKQPGEFAKGVKVTGEKVDTRIRHGKKVPGVKGKIGSDDINIHSRIGRTQRYRDIKATQLKETRKGKK